MNLVLNCFEAAFLINANGQFSRLASAMGELKKVGIEFERFPAVIPENIIGPKSSGAIACTLSHYEVVKLAKERGYMNVVIFEDDIIFRSTFLTVWEKIAEQLSHINYDLFYFYDWENLALSDLQPRITEITGTLCTHAYAVHSQFFEEFLDAVQKQAYDCVIDRILQPMTARKWAVIPNLVGQAEGESTVWGGCRNLRWCARDG